MSVHIEWVLIQDFTLGGDRHRLRIGNVRLGEALEEWLDDYQAACTVRIFDDRAYFSLAIHEQGRLDFSRARARNCAPSSGHWAADGSNGSG